MQESNETHEVVCNQPVILGAGIENKIVYNFEIEAGENHEGVG